jgi:hypothetical protein
MKIVFKISMASFMTRIRSHSRRPSRLRALAFSSLGALVVSSLAAALPACGAPTASLTAGPGASEHLYRARCSSCHALPVVQSLTRSEWEDVLPRMSDRAHLEPDERAAIHDFILGPDTASAVPSTSPGGKSVVLTAGRF